MKTVYHIVLFLYALQLHKNATEYLKITAPNLLARLLELRYLYLSRQKNTRTPKIDTA